MIDIKKFHDELIDLWNNFYNTDEVYDIIFVEDDYIEVKCENKKVANQFADFIMAYYKAPICYDFHKGNGCYQFSISPSLMIRESKNSARKSLKEDSLDDIIPMGHSEYFDTLIEFLKDKDVPFRISHTASGGKICYVENDIDFISVIFKSPKHGYELLKMIEMYGDGSVYLSRKMGSAWYSNHVPLNEVYVWDMDKDEFVNYKGKVLKNITYDDIVESKKSARKSIKEASESVIIDGKKTNFKINDYGTFFGEKIKYMLIGKPLENKDVLADFLEENSNFEFEEYKIPYSTVYYIYNDEKSLFGVAYKHYIRLTNDEKDAKIMLAYATDKRDLYNGL